MYVEGAGGISTTEDGSHRQVRGQTSPGFSQGALLRHLSSQVRPDTRRVSIDEDADPDHGAGLEMTRLGEW